MRHPRVIIAATLSSLLMMPAFAQSPPAAAPIPAPTPSAPQDPLGAAYVRNMQSQVGQAVSQLALVGAQVEVLQAALADANAKVVKLQAELDAGKKSATPAPAASGHAPPASNSATDASSSRNSK